MLCGGGSLREKSLFMQEKALSVLLRLVFGTADRDCEATLARRVSDTEAAVCRAVSRRQDGTEAVDRWLCLLSWTVPRRPGAGGVGGQGHSRGPCPVPLSPTSPPTSPGAIFT